ncbi:putative WD40/YVTN repeat-like-containing domain, WD40 repeat-like-containing domain protein [Pseudoloma neurophilia]|uniref:Putative WD40/YVTN repeat-like-containing domain, WD40 repeat-like-containing domain protein n=1 Tax=Pseudoloma neurophilia TaxID=146866 RepID=A0A0R0LZQ4_9MICR|nr:putative WD40/YVTN repeat-like-containing domain, WD40 repeat-like-containing domain protein [Pseudoloma neurophilia]
MYFTDRLFLFITDVVIDGKQVYFLLENATVYHLNKKKEIFLFKTMPEKISIKNHHILYIENYQIFVYNIKTKKTEKFNQKLPSEVECISFNKKIAISCYNGEILIFNENFEFIEKIKICESRIPVVLQSDNKIYAISENGTIAVYIDGKVKTKHIKTHFSSMTIRPINKKRNSLCEEVLEKQENLTKQLAKRLSLKNTTTSSDNHSFMNKSSNISEEQENESVNTVTTEDCESGTNNNSNISEEQENESVNTVTTEDCESGINNNSNILGDCKSGIDNNSNILGDCESKKGINMLQRHNLMISSDVESSTETISEEDDRSNEQIEIIVGDFNGYLYFFNQETLEYKKRYTSSCSIEFLIYTDFLYCITEGFVRKINENGDTKIYGTVCSQPIKIFRFNNKMFCLNYWIGILPLVDRKDDLYDKIMMKQQQTKKLKQ